MRWRRAASKTPPAPFPAALILRGGTLQRLAAGAGLFLCLLAAGCAPKSLAQREPVTNTFKVTPVSGAPDWKVALSSDNRRFGGYTAIAIAPDVQGTRHLIAVSERGFWLDTPLPLNGSSKATFGALRDPAGQMLLDNRDRWATGLARLTDGSLAVVFAARARLWRYPAAWPPFSTPPVAMPLPPEIAALPYVAGPITLGLTVNGRLLLTYSGRGWTLDGTTWTLLPPFPGARTVSATEVSPGAFLTIKWPKQPFTFRVACGDKWIEPALRFGAGVSALAIDGDDALVMNNDGYTGQIPTELIHIPIPGFCDP